MTNILLVGAGNLGRRHLQSLKLCQNKLRIFVVEPYDEALALAKSAYSIAESSTLEHIIEFYRDIDDISDEIDIAIVATPANGRLGLLKKILQLGVKDLVLEKIAFNSVADIDEAGSLVDHYQVRAWINCPRRLNPYYQKLRRTLSSDPITKFEVEGQNFGLACNAIHFLDLCAFLSRTSSYQLDLAGIQKVVPSKRDQYIEFFGDASGIFENGAKFKITCNDLNSGVKFVIKISTENVQYRIDEISGLVEIVDEKASTREEVFRQPFQSELTGPLVDEIIQYQRCGLTDFNESMNLHRPFIEAAYEVYASKHMDNSHKVVPIT